MPFVRSYDATDEVEVNRIALAAWEQYRLVFSDWPRLERFFADASTMATQLELLVAIADEQIAGLVGYVAPQVMREPMFPKEWAVIRMLSVDPAFRGRGIGRLLSEACIGRARRDKATVVGLHTSPVMQVALPMYLRMGFVHHQDIPNRNGVAYALYTLTL